MFKRLKNKFKNRLYFYSKKRFTCPICGYCGFFLDFKFPTGKRVDSICYRCGALERHRLQALVLYDILSKNKKYNILHVAPSEGIKGVLKMYSSKYVTADLEMKSVDYNFNLCKIPFDNKSFDIIYASHVLEDISDDITAIKEIHRVLTNDGFAILPVPIIKDKTIEYEQPKIEESSHIRAPGLDYFERYKIVFKNVEIFDSDNFDKKYQIEVISNNNKLKDYVPVCYK